LAVVGGTECASSSKQAQDLISLKVSRWGCLTLC